MSHSVYVAGMGIISAIGNNITESLDAFKLHRSGVGSVKFLETVHKHEFPLAEVKYSNEELAGICGLPIHLSRTILLSYYAARQAMDTMPSPLFEKARIGFISASSVGGMDKTEFFFEDFMIDRQSGDLRKVKHHDCGKPTNVVCEKLGIKGFVS